MLHHIQKTILDTLATAERLRYSEIKPDELDGNVFGYHLKQLLADKMIVKNNAGDYSLAAAGREYIVHRYESRAESAHSIFLVVIKSGENYLLRERLVQPHLGATGFLHGEPRADEPIVETAKKRLFAKTGIIADLHVRASGFISISENGELQSYSHAVVLYGEADSTLAITADTTGRNFFAHIDETENLLPSCMNIIELLERNDPWFELHYTL